MIRFRFDPEKLQGHPCVYDVTRMKLVLTYALRVQLYKVWKVKQDASEMLQVLNENGLTEDLVGKDFFSNMAMAFRMSGYPIPHRSECTGNPDFKEENPLILSGKYIPKSRGLVITDSFMEEIGNRFPEVSVEESIRMAGLDPVDVGYNRIRKIMTDLEIRKKEEYQKQVDAFMVRDTSDDGKETGDSDREAETKQNKAASLNLHPYVKSAGSLGVQMKNVFYNEAYLLFPLGLEKIFDIFELPLHQFPEHNRILISQKLYSWVKGDECLKGISEQILRIRRTKAAELDRMVREQFGMLGKGIARMDIGARRRFCGYLQELPRDTSGFYTCARIRELCGISKSTYYALLNDEGYGKASEKRTADDETDIKVIREVLEYKGFEKGIRQVYMLMPKVTGQSFSIYRIRRLMNKYGIRTTIRRPSRNRKAIKELLARNKKANLLMRKFRMYRPNEVRLTDVTYLDYGDGLRAYGSASVDPVTGRLICFVVSENNDLQLALDTLEAMDEHPAKSGAILHSDQGMLYMTDDFQTAVVEKELNQSMSRRGNCWDNAPQESFFGHFKDECHYQKCKTVEELRSMISNYAIYYNTERGMWDKGRMTPEEYENYLDAMDEEEWKNYLEAEEERYRKNKEASVAKAVEESRQYRDEIQKKLEGLKR